MKAGQFILGTVALLLLSVSGWASDTMKAKIQIYQAVHIGSTQLAPGEYKMTWTTVGPGAEVTFWQGKKEIVTVPAEITQGRSGYDAPVLVTDSASNTLTGVDLPKVSVSFTSSGTAASK